MRPSEAAGLRWTDMDLDQRQGRVQGSRHSYFRSRKTTKTKAARRTVQFTSETTALLKSIMPLHVEPATPVFTNVDGEPIEPKVFSTHWYHCLRALGIRMRGLYCTKDTFCSLAVTRVVNPSWLEQQTGVAWATLKKHYAKYIPDQGRDEFDVMLGGRSLTGLVSWRSSRTSSPTDSHGLNGIVRGRVSAKAFRLTHKILKAIACHRSCSSLPVSSG